MSQFASMKSPVPVAADAKSPLFCPKPRRPVAPLRCHQSGYSDAGVDLLDLLLSKGDEGKAASPQPPLFCGSPPRRVSNPVVHDRLFGKDCPPMPAWLAVAPATPAPLVAAWPSPCPAPVVAAAWPSPCPAPVVERPTPRPAQPTMSPRSAAGCSRGRFGLQPAAVRVEGFDCLNRGRGGRSHGITAMA